MTTQTPAFDSAQAPAHGFAQTPKLRFPEFSNKWEVKKLGEIAEISSGGTPSRAKKEYWNGNIPWVSTTLIDFNIIDKTEEQITEEGLKNSSAKIFPKGTLLMLCMVKEKPEVK